MLITVLSTWSLAISLLKILFFNYSAYSSPLAYCFGIYILTQIHSFFLNQHLLFFKFMHICVCMHGKCMGAQCLERPGRCRIPWCSSHRCSEPLGMGPRIVTSVFCRSSKYSKVLNHLSSPSLCLYIVYARVLSWK